MPKNEDGESELVLGNRQLLSVFFIVVVLLGVFFTAGYIVGKSSVVTTTNTADAGRTIDSKPLIVERPPPAGGQSTPDHGSAPVPNETTPSDTDPPSRNSKPVPASRPAPRPEAASPTPDVPAPGASYLQVAAVAKAEAELFVDVLAKKGFQAMYSSVPEKPQMYRVLVGPFQDSAAVAQARTDLNKAGFKGFEAILRRY